MVVHSFHMTLYIYVNIYHFVWLLKFTQSHLLFWTGFVEFWLLLLSSCRHQYQHVCVWFSTPNREKGCYLYIYIYIYIQCIVCHWNMFSSCPLSRPSLAFSLYSFLPPSLSLSLSPFFPPSLPLFLSPSLSLSHSFYTCIFCVSTLLFSELWSFYLSIWETSFGTLSFTNSFLFLEWSMFKKCVICLIGAFGLRLLDAYCSLLSCVETGSNMYVFVILLL